MDVFNFEINLNYKMETFTIKPPTSYSCLVEVVQEKYDLKIITQMVFVNEDHEVNITGDSEYLSMFDYVKKKNLHQVEILIKSEEGMSMKKKKSLRKRSSIQSKPRISAQCRGSGMENGFVNDQLMDIDYKADMRNLKFGKEEGKWSNQCTNYKELKRIYYIKIKKEMQREEQRQKEAEKNPPKKEQNEIFKSKTRMLKHPKDMMIINEIEQNKSNKNENCRKKGKKMNCL